MVGSGGPDSTFDKFEKRENAKIIHVLSKTLDGFPLTHGKIRESTIKDVDCDLIIQYLFSGD